MAKKVYRPGLRIALIIGSALIGIVFPYAFLLTLFFAWTLYSQLTDNSPEYVPPPRFHGTEADPEWRMYYENLCESPAEEAFLKAMIDAHDMKPGDDALVGNGIRLDMQIKVSRYRLDFVANRTHIIEIDGAAWHSSPEAIERDRIRDEYMVKQGYKVLRIPAKVVLYTPKEGLMMVDAFLGRTPDPAPTVNSFLTNSPLSIRIKFPAPELRIEEQEAMSDLMKKFLDSVSKSTTEKKEAIPDQANVRVAKATDSPDFLVDKSFNPLDLDAEVGGSEKPLTKPMKGPQGRSEEI